MKITDEIRDAIKVKVKEAGSQEKFSKKVSVKQATIARYLSGTTEKISSSAWGHIYNEIKEALYRNIFVEPINNVSASEIKDLLGDELDDIMGGKSAPSWPLYEKLKKQGIRFPGLEPDLQGFIWNPDTEESPPSSQYPYLKQIREGLNLTQQDLSALSGVPQRTISAIESSNREPNQKDIGRLAKATNVTVEELIHGPSQSSPAKTRLPDAFGSETRIIDLPGRVGDLVRILLQLDKEDIKKLTEDAEALLDAKAGSKSKDFI